MFFPEHTLLAIQVYSGCMKSYMPDLIPNFKIVCTMIDKVLVLNEELATSFHIIFLIMLSFCNLSPFEMHEKLQFLSHSKFWIVCFLLFYCKQVSLPFLFPQHNFGGGVVFFLFLKIILKLNSPLLFFFLLE